MQVNQKPTKEDGVFYPGDCNRNALEKRPTEKLDDIAETGSVTFEPSTDHFYKKKARRKSQGKYWLLFSLSYSFRF